MNPEAQTELDRIVALQPAELSEAEAGFLRARRSYLNEEQRTVFAEVLAAGESVPNTESSVDLPKSTEVEETSPHRTRKASKVSK